jgi:hypothetical protein
MRAGRERWLSLALVVTLCASFQGHAGAAPAPQQPASREPTAAAANPAEQRIYRGTYYLRGAPASSAQLFWYERWVKEEGGLLRATHVHHAFDGRVVLRQSALHSPDYALARFDSEQRQTGVKAQASVLGSGRVRLERSSASGHESVLLQYRHPLVVGPTLYGFLRRHWDELTSGRSVVFDYLSIERLDTYAFETRRVASAGDTVSFELAPSSWVLSLLVSPLRVVFDAKTRQALRYEGPSPVMLESGSKLESFDARIEYSERAAAFR